MGNLILIVLPIVVVVGIYGSIFLIRFLLNRWKNKDYGRPLTQAEKEDVEKLTQILVEDQKKAKYPYYFGLTVMGGLVPVALGTGAFFGLIWLIHSKWRGQILLAMPEKAIPINADIAFSFSELVAMFAGIFVSGWIVILIARRSVLFAKYLTYQVGWGTLKGGVRSQNELKNDVTHLFYLGKIEPRDFEPDSDSLVLKVFEGMNKKWIFATYVLTGLSFIFLIFDVHNYSWVDDREIIQNRYFSFGEEKFGPDQITSVDKVCWITVPDNVLKVNLDYKITGPGGREFDFRDASWDDIMPLIEDIESRVGYKTKSTRVKIAPALIDRIPANLESCVELLNRKNQYDDRLKAKLWEIFNLN